jgi:hypothetical protein
VPITLCANFDSLPLAKVVRRHDADYILNNLRMNLVAVHEEFRRRARLAEIRQNLEDFRAMDRHSTITYKPGLRSTPKLPVSGREP